jgi:acetyl-CoA decarbonylase/synthase, CODH/ACS complex subunit gamma
MSPTSAGEQLAEASAPPIRPVALGAGVRACKIGGETVMFRHEKTFYNPTGLAALVPSDMGSERSEKSSRSGTHISMNAWV